MLQLNPLSLISRVLVFSLAFCVSPASVTAQGLPTEDRLPFTGRDSSSEATSATIDDLTSRAAATNSTIFVISRLGRRERPEYNYRRLHNALYRVKDYYGSYRPNLRVVGGIGERTDSEGVVDFYLDGRLFYRVTFGLNRDFIVDCCQLPDEPLDRTYFPHYRGKRKYQFP